METPRTAKGKTCKKCLAKGSKCHLHANIVSMQKSEVKRTSSIKGSLSPAKRKTRKVSSRSPVKMSSPAAFPGFDTLPREAQVQVLLNVEPSELRNICSSSKRIRERICGTPHFKELYRLRYPGVFIIKDELKIRKDLIDDYHSYMPEGTAVFNNDICQVQIRFKNREIRNVFLYINLDPKMKIWNSRTKINFSSNAFFDFDFEGIGRSNMKTLDDGMKILGLQNFNYQRVRRRASPEEQRSTTIKLDDFVREQIILRIRDRIIEADSHFEDLKWPMERLLRRPS